ncbi:hypothetical protein VOLCADRAFT_120913 [Volvox carteri f. nagariensis]|uniref:KOW domain-containing protein n=1 Tax=Volvox carteri f. nagariensis TaxID=3068 RepID=D8TWK5_VOLCA|nr:uncharacterized protein VOLCADRAFT_120913 [Volvox carteri f. nagariensis]EFJ48168.1 hypothetical protein VOLCADRAFT_120913 [Volvox carteri f. nagariensis]|eukprot:XP_002950853.1 hypothetical protein VOLCADRAFT_120913 [Volvox carteri f. nagariensis]
MPQLLRAIRPMFKTDRWRICRDDIVYILSGPDKGKTGRVLEVFKDPRLPRVIVEGRNMRKKKIRTGPGDDDYFVVTMEAPLHYSQVQVADPETGLPTRVIFMFTPDGKRVRQLLLAYDLPTLAPGEHTPSAAPSSLALKAPSHAPASGPSSQGAQPHRQRHHPHTTRGSRSSGRTGRLQGHIRGVGSPRQLRALRGLPPPHPQPGTNMGGSSPGYPLRVLTTARHRRGGGGKGAGGAGGHRRRPSSRPAVDGQQPRTLPWGDCDIATCRIKGRLYGSDGGCGGSGLSSRGERAWLRGGRGGGGGGGVVERWGGTGTNDVAVAVAGIIFLRSVGAATTAV